MRIKISEEEISQILNLKEYGFNTVEIGKMFNRNNTTIGRLLKKHGFENKGNKIELTKSEEDLIRYEYLTLHKNSIQIWEDNFKDKCGAKFIELYIKDNDLSRGQGRGSYNPNTNHDYFETIDNENKAYLLGYLTADGSITGKVIRLECAERDRELVDFAVKEICPTAKIGKSIRVNKSTTVYSYLGSIDIVKDLVKYNVVKNKQCADLSMPVLEDCMMKHFVRGYFDGDGSVFEKKSRPAVSICADEKFAYQLQDYLIKQGIKSTVIDMRKYGINIFHVRIENHDSTQGFFDLIYGLDGFRLNRKYNKYKTLLRNANTEVTIKDKDLIVP